MKRRDQSFAFGVVRCLRLRASNIAREATRLNMIAVMFALLAGATRADEAAQTEPALTDSDREHWAYQPILRPELPAVRNAAWCRTPIDRFILAALESKGLKPAAEASPEVLARRLSFDLTGLPPLGEKRGGGDKESEYLALVDRLLASPEYAERWAQHWLDVARYADSDGYEHDTSRPEAWRYRDWVIAALDRDLPVDEFIRLQIAGDELHPGDADAQIATGFLLCGPDMPDLNRQDERRSMLLNEITGTVGSALLGLQIGCAQCHDHKFEPLSQADFYRLRACFETSQFMGKGTREEDAGDDKEDTKADLRRVFRPLAQPWPESRLLVRGQFDRPGAAVEPGFPRVATVALQTVEQFTHSARGRRTELADWVTRPDNPLTARVLANRVWQEHFGTGLVSTPSDFGYMGDTPSHPELLDWLATELMRNDWSLKALHRLIVTSAVYRQSSRATPEFVRQARAIDPENRFLTPFPRRRLDGEAIRDAVLAAGDTLSTRRGGPGVMPPLPPELLGAIRKDHWKVDADEENHRRRSIYLFVRRNLRLPLLEAFDKPDTMASCPRRNRSTVAPQALVLLNSEFSVQAAGDLADYVRRTAGDNVENQAALAYRRTLGRDPTPTELAEAKHLIASDDAGLADFCLALFNLNEFVYVD